LAEDVAGSICPDFTGCLDELEGVSPAFLELQKTILGKPIQLGPDGRLRPGSHSAPWHDPCSCTGMRKSSRVSLQQRAAVAGHASEVVIQTGGVRLEGSLTIPTDSKAIVAFAHGSGSSRHSPRNRYVARTLNEAGLATLLFDLLTADEERIDEVTGELRFDIPLLADRLTGAVDWLAERQTTRGFVVGLFGASTGAAAALIAAAKRPHSVRAVVSRGGRPDLSGDFLAKVRAPTLLIVGGWDAPVIELNQRAASRISAESRIEIVPGATHLFEESGKLEEVARLACGWFERHLVT
jgi:dienelactone hydrolase